MQKLDFQKSQKTNEADLVLKFATEKLLHLEIKSSYALCRALESENYHLYKNLLIS